MRASSIRSGLAFSWLLLVVVIVGLAGCAAVPIQEMSDARQAVQAAKSAGVEASDNQLLKLAEDHLKSAELKLKRRWYQSAKEDALLARDAAVKARVDSDTGQ